MTITDWETFLVDYNDSLIFKIYKHKNVFTPLEQEEKYIDQETEEYVGDFVLTKSIELPNKDVLLGFKRVYTECKELEDYTIEKELCVSDDTYYYLLTDIDLVSVKRKDYLEEE